MAGILVAMPAYDEECYIGSMVINARRYADKVLVVDDGSRDRTADVAERAGAEVIRHEKNMGYGAAIQTILRTALKDETTCLVVLDADNQHSTEDIPVVAVPILRGGADMVVGRRESGSIPRYRRAGQGVLSLFTRIVSGSKVSDTQSGFRAYSRNAISGLSSSLKQTGMAVSSEITATATRLGLTVVEVPVGVKYGRNGSTHNPVAQGTHTLTQVLAMISEQRPLLFFGATGIVSLLFGFFAGLRSYNTLLATGVPPVGTMILSMLSIVIGALSVFTGTILHVLARRLGGR